jgi:hypothetical protein
LAICILLLVRTGSANADVDLQPPPRADYRIEVSFVDDTVIPYSLVYTRLSVTNVCDHDLPKPDMLFGARAFRCRFLDESGEYPAVKVPHFDTWSGYDGVLAPRQTAVQYFSWNQYFWWPITNASEETFEGHRFDLLIELGPSVFSGLDSSNSTLSAPLWIIPAEGDEKAATATFLSACAHFRTREYQRCQAECRSLIEEHEQSALVEPVLELLWILERHVFGAGKQPGDEVVSLAYELVHRRPGSPLLIAWGRFLRHDFEKSAFDSLKVLMGQHQESAPYLNVLLDDRELDDRE